MPPLIAFAGALGGLAVVRWAYKTAVRINRELEEARLARVAEAQTGDIPDAPPRPGHRRLSSGLTAVIPGRALANPKSDPGSSFACHGMPGGGAIPPAPP